MSESIIECEVCSCFEEYYEYSPCCRVPLCEEHYSIVECCNCGLEVCEVCAERKFLHCEDCENYFCDYCGSTCDCKCIIEN